MALAAVYTDTDGSPVHKIALVDFDERSNYRILTDTSDHIYVQPRFSPDKSRLVFGDQTARLTDAGPQLVLYDIAVDSMRRLTRPHPGGNMPLAGHLPVWSADGGGIYFFHDSPFTIQKDVLAYSLQTDEIDVVHCGCGYSTYAVDRMGRDTLIVFSNRRFHDEGSWNVLSLMDRSGDYISHINNPHLELVHRGGLTTKGAHDPTWNDALGLFAFSGRDSTLDGRRIAVTDLDGSYYREYTSGDEFLDRHPRWGPDGTILFDRVLPPRSGGTGASRVMLLDTESGEVSEFVDPTAIDGAAGLLYPDY